MMFKHGIASIAMLSVSGWAAPVGRDALDSGQYLRALGEAEARLRVAPDDAQAWAVKAQALAATMRLGEAMAAADRAVSLRGDLGEALLARGLTKAAVAVQARNFSSLRNASAAMDDLKAAVAADPSLVTGWMTLGMAYQELPGLLGGSTKKALQCADSLRRVNPARGDVLAGTILTQAGRWGEAEPYFGRALAVASWDGQVLYGYLEALGSRPAREAMGEEAQRQRLAGEAQRLWPQAKGRARALEAVSSAFLDAGRPEDAWRVAKEGLGNADLPSVLRVQLGKVAARGGVHREEGLAALDQALREPLEGGLGGPQALLWRKAQILQGLGRQEDAKAVARQALKIDPKHPGARKVVGG